MKPGKYSIKLNTKWKDLTAVDEVEIRVAD
jgi:hypothetical protein